MVAPNNRYANLEGGVPTNRALATARGTALAGTAIGLDGSGNFPVATVAPGALTASLLATGAAASNLGVAGATTSLLAGGTHLLGIPNGSFEDGLAGWAPSTTGSGSAVQLSQSYVATGKNSVLLFAPNSGCQAQISIQFLQPCTAGGSYNILARAMTNGGSASLRLQAVFYDKNQTFQGNQTFTDFTNASGLNVNGFTEVGYSFTPPAGSCYYALNIVAVASSSSTTGGFYVDEVRVNRAVNPPELAPYLTPGVGALVARTVTQRDLDIGISARDFLKGDGTLESAAAVAAMVAACADGSTLFFPAGTYNFPGSLAFTDKSVEVRGQSKGAVKLLFSGATDGVTSYVTSDRSKRFAVRDLQILAGYQKTSGSDTGNNGAAINIRSAPGATRANYVYSQASVTNVSIKTQNDDPGSAGSYWNVGLNVVNTWYPYFSEIDHFTLPGATAFCVFQADAPSSDGHYYASVAPMFKNCRAYYGIAAFYVGGYLEGLEAISCDFAAQNYGVYVPSSTTPGGAAAINRAYALWFTGCHFNIYVSSFYMNTCADLRVNGCDLQSLHNANTNVVQFQLYDQDGWQMNDGAAAGGGTLANGSAAADAFAICDGSGTADAGGSVTRNQGTRQGLVSTNRMLNFQTQIAFLANSKYNSFIFNKVYAGQPLSYSDSGVANNITSYDLSGTTIFLKSIVAQSEFQPRAPIRTTNSTRATLYSTFPPASWGASYTYVSNPEANQGGLVYSDATYYRYAGNGAIVTNS